MWSQITPSALCNATGIMVFSLCNKCSSSITIRDFKYSSNFCQTCDKRTFSMKYPSHVDKYPSMFYEFKTTADGKPVEEPELGRSWNELVPCSVVGRGAVVSVVLGGCCKPSVAVEDSKLSFSFCEDCQRKTVYAKFPKPFKQANVV